jgi:hypothetical protein
MRGGIAGGAQGRQRSLIKNNLDALDTLYGAIAVKLIFDHFHLLVRPQPSPRPDLTLFGRRAQ